MGLSLKQKIIFSLVSGLGFAILHGSMKFFVLGEDFSWFTFIFNLLFFGFSFGFGALYFMSKTQNKMMKRISIELQDGEEIIHAGPANLRRGLERVGGKLVKTNFRIVFKPHKLNIQNQQLEIPLEMLKSIALGRQRLLVKEMDLIDTSGKKFEFLVYEGEQWINAIEVPALNG